MQPSTFVATDGTESPAEGSGDRTPPSPTLIGRIKDAVAVHGEQALAEVPATLRRLRMLLLVAAVSLPLFLIGVLVALFRLVH